MKRLSKLVCGISTLFFVCGAYSQNADTVEKQEGDSAIQKANAENKPKRLPVVEQMQIGSGRLQSRPRVGGYYVIFDNLPDGPKFRELVNTRPTTIKDFQKQEIIFISRDLKFAEPDYRDFKPHPNASGDFICWTGALRTRRDNNTTDYNPCESALVDKSVNAASYAFMAVFTLGVGAVTGTGSSTAKVNQEKVRSLIGIDVLEAAARLTVDSDCVVDYGKVGLCRTAQTSFANLSESLSMHMATRKLEQYRGLYAKARTSQDLEKFKTIFANDDPERLVEKAQQDIPLLKRQEWLSTYRENFSTADNISKLEKFVRSYSDDDPDKLVPQAQGKLKTEYARLDRIQHERDEAARQYAAKLANWRRSLKVGDDTFCGPVIEVRHPMIKIAVSAQLQGYAPEAWLKSDQIFPPELGCRNTNGRLTPLNS